MTVVTRCSPPRSAPWTPPGVYEPQEDTWLLTRAMRREDIVPGTDVLDLGTGSGALALEAARLGARVTAVDISWRAVLTARMNALLSRQYISVRHGDLASAVPGCSFDLVISNPPYVPSPGHGSPRGAARAWDAGLDGRLLLDRICDTATALLRPQGALLVVHSALCGVEDTLSRLAAVGLSAAVTDRLRVPFGRVLRSRLAWLRERGLPADDLVEELVVVRAVRA
ncbi:HemK2/MTQ2 family protein methyltransferase [Streptomyces yaanensis]|uniref:HemK2/MTQ2 family protein methyltransferase n=1 Tax=Streptomyces yaanensis TaxID=1142239 RepID=A0ABV7S8T5_9ACTN|nr:HemK2/MTQ2 family protein methyltransferase [Streptomyces sp. CGMCC 4.7035]WNB99461.1 methyltransferase [Streptomyces sp. CGMCC 4.7035]